MAKIIQNFNIDLRDMSAEGGIREFTVEGDANAIFSLEITNEDSPTKYYNFNTETFTTTKSRLNRKSTGESGVYQGEINFPTVTDNDHYDIYLWAESHFDTIHADYNEVRFGDDSIDINSSRGSNSNLLQKIIYQYTDVAISISAESRGGAGFASMSVTNTPSITVGRGSSTGTWPFSVELTANTDKAFEILRQPVENDVMSFTQVAFGTPLQIHGENIWTGSARSTDTTNGSVSSGTTVTMDTAVASKMAVGDRVTGTGISSASVVTVSSLSGTYTFVTSEAVSIGDGVTLTFTPPYYHRWNVGASSTMHELLPGMIYDDGDVATIPRSTVAPYEDKTTYTTETHNEDGTIVEIQNEAINASALALDTLGYKPTITNGVVTKQLGAITFADQISNDASGGSNKLFYGYGTDYIKSIHNTDISISDLKVELSKMTTTTTAAVNNSVTIPVAERRGTVQNISTISGIGIDASSANPTVASATDEGDGNWTLSAAQTLDEGVTLTVENTSKIITITGNMIFKNVNKNAANFRLYFDVEKFIKAS
jgi:hypothetical protein